MKKILLTLFLCFVLIQIKAQLIDDETVRDEQHSYQNILIDKEKALNEQKYLDYILKNKIKTITKLNYNDKNKLVSKYIYSYSKYGNATSIKEYYEDKLYSENKMEYDERNNLILKTFSGFVDGCDGPEYRIDTSFYKYNSNNQLIFSVENADTVEFEYNAIGKRIKESYIYNEKVNVFTSFQYQDTNLIKVAYNTPKDTTSTVQSLSEYDNKGNCVLNVLYSLGSIDCAREYMYDSLGHITKIKHINKSFESAYIEDYFYLNANLVKKTESIDEGKVNVIDTLIYDANNRLIEKTRKRFDNGYFGSDKYTYDAAGNVVDIITFSEGKLFEETKSTYVNGILDTEENYFEGEYQSKTKYSYEFYE